MNANRIVIIVNLFFAVACTNLEASPQKCGGSDIANGPFIYAAQSVTQATFSGTDGAASDTRFMITAPSPSPDTAEPNVFPGQGAMNACSTTASANIGVLEIQKVTDASGTPLSDPLSIDLDSSLGASITGAFTFNPAFWSEFSPGSSQSVTVTVSNPNVDPTDYGEYHIKLAAKADGYGIGVGPGVTFSLILTAPALTDNTPPVVTVTKPAGDDILGITGVEVQAYDPADSPAATGLVSLSATISSVNLTISNSPITLTFNSSLPASPGVTVTGTGTFVPTGGTGISGTTDALAFTSTSRSGIGTYIITAEATDGAGNSASASKTFKVNYSVAFQKQSGSTSTPCTSSTGSLQSKANCMGQLEFTVNRSNVTSDGAFMFDHTVEVDLVLSGGTVLATHSWGTGSISSVTQIDSASHIYKTNFKRGDLYSIIPTTPSTYQAKVYFKDVDGNRVLQGTSEQVTF